MKLKLLGGILLVSGTTMGAGMLALPLISAQIGYFTSLIFLLLGWLLMVLGALLFLEINLALPAANNYLSMVQTTFGPTFGRLTGIIYLLLYYSLIAAYCSAGASLTALLCKVNGYTLSHSYSTFSFVVILGSFIYLGISFTDYINRYLMTVKLLIFISIIGLACSHFRLDLIKQETQINLTSPYMVIITSFGFAASIPSLATYFNRNTKNLCYIIWFGSVIPLIIYLFWNTIVMGIIPREGINGLNAIFNNPNPATELGNHLAQQVQVPFLNLLIKLFTSLCILTSFLGVSLGLNDFWIDALQLNRFRQAKLLSVGLTFIPPLIITLFFPKIFITALNFAGIFCILLLVLLPIIMVWKARYAKKLIYAYRAPVNKPLLILMGVATLAILVQTSFQLK